MENQENRISRVERNKRRNRRNRNNKSVSHSTYTKVGNCIQLDSNLMNSSEVRVRRTERNKKKRRSIFFSVKVKHRDTETSINKSKSVKLTACTLGFLGVLGAYYGTDLCFKSHFYYGTSINNLNVSGKSVEQVEELFKNNMTDYSIKLIGRNNLDEEIYGADIDLVYDENKNYEIDQIKAAQNNSSWVKSLFLHKENGISKENTYTSSIVSYSPEKLGEIIDKIEAFKDTNVSEPKSAYLKYNGKSFEIEKEDQGNKINKDKLLDEICSAISKGQDELDADKMDCYEKPKYISSSKEVLNAQSKLNQYKDFKLTYNLGGTSEEISGDKLLSLFECDDNYNYSLSQDKIYSYVNDLCTKYNTYGTSHKFTTTDGNSILINGGDYGYEIDKDKEIVQLNTDIEGKKAVSREPVYSKTALGDITNDIGNTYVEINMGKQHLWFYKDGELITEGDIVTGNVSHGTATPEGIYSLKYKERDSVLVGDNYRSPVSFWMPFNNNIGIHDASWRSVFGGKIYLTSGSHGCVNAPYGVAQAIYSNIEAGIPIVCYY